MRHSHFFSRYLHCFVTTRRGCVDFEDASLIAEKKFSLLRIVYALATVLIREPTFVVTLPLPFGSLGLHLPFSFLSRPLDSEKEIALDSCQEGRRSRHSTLALSCPLSYCSSWSSLRYVSIVKEKFLATLLSSIASVDSDARQSMPLKISSAAKSLSLQFGTS